VDNWRDRKGEVSGEGRGRVYGKGGRQKRGGKERGRRRDHRSWRSGGDKGGWVAVEERWVRERRGVEEKRGTGKAMGGSPV